MTNSCIVPLNQIGNASTVSVKAQVINVQRCDVCPVDIEVLTSGIIVDCALHLEGSRKRRLNWGSVLCAAQAPMRRPGLPFEITDLGRPYWARCCQA
eukprot:5779633-Amphidinium_carterae.1